MSRSVVVFVFLVVLLSGGCTRHEGDMKPVDITVDVNVRVEKAVEDFYGDIYGDQEQKKTDQ